MRAALLALLLGCATAPASLPPVPATGRAVDLDTLVPPTEPARYSSPPSARRYEDRPVGPADCPDLPPGVLVSEAAYAETTALLAERDRLKVEAESLRKVAHEELVGALEIESLLRTGLRDADAARARETERARRNFWLGVGGGVLGGAAAVLLGAWAVGKVAR